MSEVIIRAAIASDLEATRDLLQHSDAWHAQRLPSECREPNAPRLTAQELAETMANPRCLIIVAACDGRVVGFAEASHVDATRADEAAVRASQPDRVAGVPTPRLRNAAGAGGRGLEP